MYTWILCRIILVLYTMLTHLVMCDCIEVQYAAVCLCYIAHSGEGEFTSVTLFRGGQRSIKLTLRNLGTASEVKLATVGSSGGAAFTVSVSPTTVTVAANAMTEITLTVQAPVSIPESTTASLQLIVTATASDNILRNDYVVFDIFASNIELPVVRSAVSVYAKRVIYHLDFYHNSW